MKTTLRRIVTAAVLATAFGVAPAGAAVITSSFIESGDEVGTKEHVKGTIGTFSFANPVSSLGSITGIGLTLVLFDGDTGAGDFDVGDLTLGLDGIDTKLKLDGFRNEATNRREFFSNLSLLTVQEIADLYTKLSDGSLLAEILDADSDPENSVATADPHANQKNVITLPTTYIDDQEVMHSAVATLTIYGSEPRSTPAAVPEPASWALASLGLAGMAAVRRRRQH